MDFDTIIYEPGRISHLTLNRLERLNAVSDQMAGEIIQAVRHFDANPEALVLVVAGSGRAFCSGADVKQRQLLPRDELVRLGHAAGVRPAGGGLGLTQTVNWKPVIAAVHGYVYGSGWGIAMDCDLIVAAEETKFQITEAPRGVGGATHWGSAWYWGGGRIANEMVLTGRVVTAEEMLPLGMINRVVPQEALLKTADGLAEEVASLPPLSVRCNVRMLRWFVHRMRQEAEMYQQALRLHLSEDFHESAAAFVEKRKAVVVGR